MRHFIVLACVLAAASPAMAQLYGVTDDNLVILDPTNGSAPTVVGAHNISLPNSFVTSSMAYHVASDKLVGLVIEFAGGPNQITHLYEYNRSTGAATALASLGISSSVGYYEALEYDATLGTLLVSNAEPNNSFTHALRELSLDGSIGASYETGLDNDTLAFDLTRSLLYAADPNGPGRLFNYTGGAVDTGPVPSFLGDLAYDPNLDRHFGLDYNNGHLYRFFTDGTGGSLTTTDLGAISGDLVNGIAYVTAVPEPAAFAGALVGGLALIRRRAR